MAVTIFNSQNVLKSKNLCILFKEIFDYKNYKIQNIDDNYVLIFKDEKIVAINILNFSNNQDFSVENGFHLVKNDLKNFLLNKFDKYLSEKDFENFFQTGFVEEKNNHPNSDKLYILKVKFSNGATKQIVTNQSQVEINKNYLFALEGATTYSGLQIKESKVVNELSQGMIVGYSSLGIEQEDLIECSNKNDEYVF